MSRRVARCSYGTPGVGDGMSEIAMGIASVGKVRHELYTGQNVRILNYPMAQVGKTRYDNCALLIQMIYLENSIDPHE